VTTRYTTLIPLLAVYVALISCHCAQAVTYQITRLTDNTFTDGGPQISGNNVVWQATNAGDKEIFLYNGVTVTQAHQQ